MSDKRYIPKRESTKEQWEEYLAGCRVRNRTAYARRRGYLPPFRRIQSYDGYQQSVACVQCGEEPVVPVCGFCRDGVPHE